MNDFRFAVVGLGLFGSAALRRLCGSSDRVVGIGSPEPTDRTTHDGVFASHYDQGRLTRRTSPDRLWAEATAWTFEAIEELESETGRTILRPVGALTVQPEHVETRHGRELYEDTSRGPIDITTWERTDESWRDRFPMFDFPPGCTVRHEGPPAGVLDPRGLVAAHCEVALTLGAVVVEEMVVSVEEHRAGVEIHLASGATVSADQALVATGAFTNLLPLVPMSIPTTIETETLMLATVSPSEGRRLATAPVVGLTIDDPYIADLYMTPPLVYPDGQWKVKMGANTVDDTFPKSLDEVRTWFNRGPWVGPNASAIDESMRGAIQALWPGVEFLEFEAQPCIITMTKSDHPVVERVSDRRCVALAGNGTGAKSSAGWGRLAADLLAGIEWPDWVDARSISSDAVRQGR